MMVALIVTKDVTKEQNDCLDVLFAILVYSRSKRIKVVNSSFQALNGAKSFRQMAETLRREKNTKK